MEGVELPIALLQNEKSPNKSLNTSHGHIVALEKQQRIPRLSARLRREYSK